MKKGLTELVFIIDKSGSMHNLVEDTIGGFNSMIEKQRKVEGEALVSTVLFSNRSQVLHDRVPLTEIPAMTDKEYCVGGNTALIDAIGDAIRHIKLVHRYIREEDRPENTLFIITTDGMENASRKWNADEVKKLIEEQKKAGWEFIFMGANIDAVETAARFGIGRDRAVDYRADRKGTRATYDAMSYAVSSIRCCSKVAPDWDAAVKTDRKQNG